MSHFSRYIRPGAHVIGVKKTDKSLLVTAVRNPDQSIAVVVFNEGTTAKQFTLNLDEHTMTIAISAQAIQTIVIPAV